MISKVILVNIEGYKETPLQKAFIKIDKNILFFDVWY